MSAANLPGFHRYSDSQALAQALAQVLADQLRQALAQRGQAWLAVSGGSTPKHLFDALSRHELDWSQVTITLVDERWVPESSDRSNARLVKAMLLKHHAAAAGFLPLHQLGADTPEEGIPALEASLARLPAQFDAVVLGMGDDGHTASFFPGGDHLTEALDLNGKQRLLPMRAEGAGEPRITFSLPALLHTGALYLHIEGEAKLAVLERAERGEGEAAGYPIGAVLRQTRTPLDIYWCP